MHLHNCASRRIPCAETPFPASNSRCLPTFAFPTAVESQVRGGVPTKTQCRCCNYALGYFAIAFRPEYVASHESEVNSPCCVPIVYSSFRARRCRSCPVCPPVCLPAPLITRIKVARPAGLSYARPGYKFKWRTVPSILYDESDFITYSHIHRTNITTVLM